MARAHIELTGLWGPDQVTKTALRNAGYKVEQVRNMRTGEVVGEITAPDPGTPRRTPSGETRDLGARRTPAGGGPTGVREEGGAPDVSTKRHQAGHMTRPG